MLVSTIAADLLMQRLSEVCSHLEPLARECRNPLKCVRVASRKSPSNPKVHGAESVPARASVGVQSVRGLRRTSVQLMMPLPQRPSQGATRHSVKQAWARTTYTALRCIASGFGVRIAGKERRVYGLQTGRVYRAEIVLCHEEANFACLMGDRTGRATLSRW